MPKKGNYSLGIVDGMLSPIFVGMLATRVKKNIVFVREQKWGSGLKQQIYGDPKGEIIFVDDVTTTGRILVEATKTVRKKGAKVKRVLIGAVRDDTPVKNLKKIGVKVDSITTYEEIVKNLWPNLTKQEQVIVRKEIEDKKYNWNV